MVANVYLKATRMHVGGDEHAPALIDTQEAVVGLEGTQRHPPTADPGRSDLVELVFEAVAVIGHPD